MATDSNPTWEELMGSRDWDGLIDPVLHPDLILRCGDFSLMDAFNTDENSKYAGSSRYGKECFFEKVMHDSASLYQVKPFLYASSDLGSPLSSWLIKPRLPGSWDMYSNMMGYIVVTTDEVSKVLGRREIYIAWRGTVTVSEWLNDFDIRLVSAKELLHNEENPRKVPKVMNGWLNIDTTNNPKSCFTNLSPRDQLRKKIKELVKKDYKDEKLSIIVTGHSLGASLATLSAFDLVENDIKDIRVAAIVSASPHLGDKVFKERVENSPNLKVLYTFNIHDVVSLVPQILDWYRAVGVELKIDNTKSPYLKNDVSHVHNLQGLLHNVAGFKAMDKPFQSITGIRSITLANKDSDLLKDKYLIPVKWWVPRNNGMIATNGEWVLGQYDEPEPETQNVHRRGQKYIRADRLVFPARCNILLLYFRVK